MRDATKEERQSVMNYIKDHSEKMYTKDDMVKELEDIKLKIQEISFDQYIECGEYIGEDTQKWNLVKSDEAFKIIDNYISKLKGEQG